MIYVTGDIHGDHSIRKLSTRRFPEGRDLTRDDYVIILGDFGLVWSDPPSGEDRWWLSWLEGRPWTTLFIDGNHENHDLLTSLPVREWAHGHVHEVCPHVLHLMRGEIFDLPDVDGTTRVLAFGGARSHDIEWRTEGISWWPSELPGLEDYQHAVDSLESVGWKVDYVLTHDCPSACKASVIAPPSMYNHFGGDAERWKNDRLNGYLDEIDARLDYRLWYFGHYHVDVPALDRRHVALYHEVLPLGEMP